MKTALLFYIAFQFGFSFGQDTLSITKRFDGGWTYLIAEIDTFTIQTYSNGKIESKMEHSAILDKKRKYTRYYESGKMMWVQEIERGMKNGYSTYFNEKGNKVAAFLFANDTIIDTLFLSTKSRLLFGKITYSSIVYGGMQLEDGSSNISESSGPRRFSSFYTVKLDKKAETQKIYKSFYTDTNGDFFLELEDGLYGFFGSNVDIKSISNDQATELESGNMGWHGGWDLTQPLLINKKSFNYLHLHYSSVGYAP